MIARFVQSQFCRVFLLLGSISFSALAASEVVEEPVPAEVVQKEEKAKEDPIKARRFYVGALLGTTVYRFDFYKTEGGKNVSVNILPFSYDIYGGVYALPFLRFEGHVIHRLSASGKKKYPLTGNNGNVEFNAKMTSMHFGLDTIVDIQKIIPSVGSSKNDVYFGLGLGYGLTHLQKWSENLSRGESREVNGISVGHFDLKIILGIAFTIFEPLLIDLRMDMFFLGKVKSEDQPVSSKGNIGSVIKDPPPLPLDGKVSMFDFKVGLRYLF